MDEQQMKSEGWTSFSCIPLQHLLFVYTCKHPDTASIAGWEMGASVSDRIGSPITIILFLLFMYMFGEASAGSHVCTDNLAHLFPGHLWLSFSAGKASPLCCQKSLLAAAQGPVFSSGHGLWCVRNSWWWPCPMAHHYHQSPKISPTLSWANFLCLIVLFLH